MIDKFEVKNEVMERKGSIINAMTGVECHPLVVEEKVELTEHTKLPWSRVSALGIAFEPLSMAFQKVISGGESTSDLYKVTIPKGTHLAEFKNGSGNLGTVLDANNQISGQAALNPLIFDPTMIFMAATLANINKKLDIIMEMQEELLEFLVQKERSSLKGDLNFLTDIINNYKFNWDNDKYKNSNHVKVLDIRQEAERKIDFYREQIISKTNKKSLFHSDQEVKKQLEEIEFKFKDYQLALYLFSFASFLEIMLLENFDRGYLNEIVRKIENYSFRYRELYTKCYNQLEKHAKTSIQSRLIKGVASVNKVAGKTFAKIPVISKSQIDETLIETGERLGDFGSERIVRTIEQFIEKQNTYVQPFIENINTVNKLYNQPIELFFDKENIYMKTLAE